MIRKPRVALSRQMHFFAEFQKALAELRQQAAETDGDLGRGLEDLAWAEALRRRRARLGTVPYCAGVPAAA